MHRYLILIILAVAPISECRGAIIYGLSSGLSPLVFFPLVILFNIFTIFPLFWFLKKAGVRRVVYRILGERITKLILENRERLEKYEELALLLFVAIPFPGTGAWTGSIIASVLSMKPRKSKLIIAIGILMAGAVVFLSAYGVSSAITGLINLI